MKVRCEFCNTYAEPVPAEKKDKKRFWLRCSICGNRVGFADSKQVKKKWGNEDGQKPAERH